MKKAVFLLLSLFSSCLVVAQGVSNRWVFGYACCQPAFGGTDIDFSGGSPNIILQQRYMNFYETNGVISDRNGNLLFASNGIYVANALDDTMQNGLGLNPCLYTTQMTSHGLALPQGNLVIPFPDDSMKYYLFHESCDVIGATFATLNLYYSVIDMSLDGGLGAVIQKNTVLLNDSLVEGRIVGVKHANGRDWWVMVHQLNTGNMFKYLVTPQGISGPTIQSIGVPRDIWFGQAVFNPQGTKFAYYEPYGDLDVCDFDRCSGLFSNIIHVDINDSAPGGGAAFSSSGRYLYLSSEKYVYQFDMFSPNIDSSRLVVGVYDGYRESGVYQNFYLAALAPNNKIYINTGNSSKYFHVINYPDSASLACGFVQRGMSLPRWDAFTMPNFPNYFLGPDPLTVCDTINAIQNPITSPVESFSLFPNPVREQMYINHSLKEPVLKVSIINTLGQFESVQFIQINNGEYLQIDLSSFASGVYYVQMKTAKQVVTRKIVKE